MNHKLWPTVAFEVLICGVLNQDVFYLFMRCHLEEGVFLFVCVFLSCSALTPVCHWPSEHWHHKTSGWGYNYIHIFEVVETVRCNSWGFDTYSETRCSLACHFGLAWLLFVNAALNGCPQGNEEHWRQMWKFLYRCFEEFCRCIVTRWIKGEKAERDRKMDEQAVTMKSQTYL